MGIYLDHRAKAAVQCSDLVPEDVAKIVALSTAFTLSLVNSVECVWLIQIYQGPPTTALVISLSMMYHILLNLSWKDLFGMANVSDSSPKIPGTSANVFADILAKMLNFVCTIVMGLKLPYIYSTVGPFFSSLTTPRTSTNNTENSSVLEYPLALGQKTFKIINEFYGRCFRL